MNTDREERASRWLAWAFKLIFVWCLKILCWLACFAGFVHGMAAPSGWMTRREYEDMSFVHSFVGLIGLIFIIVVFAFFFELAIPSFGIIVFIILLLTWFCGLIKTVCFSFQRGGPSIAAKAFWIKVSTLKRVCVTNDVCSFQDRLPLKILAAVAIGLFCDAWYPALFGEIFLGFWRYGMPWTMLCWSIHWLWLGCCVFFLLIF